MLPCDYKPEESAPEAKFRHRKPDRRFPAGISGMMATLKTSQRFHCCLLVCGGATVPDLSRFIGRVDMTGGLCARLGRPGRVFVKHMVKISRSAALNIADKKTILLFYKEYEADKFIKYDRYLKRILRPIYNQLHHKQKKTGFGVSFELMHRALVNEGYDVRVNDYRTARANPKYPVGVIGFTVLLDDWRLPNPAILGPSLYDHPMLAPDLFEDRRFRKYVTLAPWAKALYEPVYGPRCFSWFAGLDLVEWPDLSSSDKTYDFLVYDKVRWDHDLYQGALIDPVISVLEKRGLTYRLLRYKQHDHTTFRQMLAGARGFLFLCEHETQGLAYQEAMSSGVPVLAWDRGYWADPLWQKFDKLAPAASSVPFFSSACGETFKDMDGFEAALDAFMAKRDEYRPRDYVAHNLSPAESARIYTEQYFDVSGP